MKKSLNLYPLLLCLLYSMAQASPPSQNDFDFLEPFNDTALVANGLELTESIAGVSLSTLLNLVIWWGVCKTAGIVSGLLSTYELAESETKELENLKTDFCLQLAPVITTAEVALAGRVSPWPLEQCWWKLLYFGGAGMAAYASATKTRGSIPVAVLIYLAYEASTRTGTGAISTLVIRKKSARDIATEWYTAWEYAVLSMASGVMAGAVIYEALIYKGLRPAKAALASVVSAAIAGTLSGILSVSTIDLKGQTKAKLLATIGAGAGVGAGVIAGSGAAIAAAPLERALAGAMTIVSAMAGVGAGAVVGAGAGASVGNGILVGALAGASALSGVGVLLMHGGSKITSDNLFIKAGVTLVPALTFAVINSLSNYAVYGYPLEQGLSETGWTQWKKFYAPLEYFSTLFK